MAITEEIDLTLESDFASAYDKWLKPERARLRENSNVFETENISRRMIDFMMNISSYDQFFREGKAKDDVIQKTIDFYFYLFGDSPAFLSRLAELDPYAPYFWGYGVTCDCCTKELNILNTNGYSLCVRCSVGGVEYMRII